MLPLNFVLKRPSLFFSGKQSKASVAKTGNPKERPKANKLINGITLKTEGSNKKSEVSPKIAAKPAHGKRGTGNMHR